MQGDGDPVRGDVQATYNRRGTHLSGVTEGTGPVQGVQGGDGGGIFDEAKYDTAWASRRGEMELENFGHRRRATDTFHGLPGQGSPVELPSGEMPRPIGN